MKISRRNILKAGLGLSVALLDSTQLLNVLAKPQANKTKNVLLVIQLLGGNDGLNTIIPYGDGKYYDLRPRIGIRQNEVIQINNQIGFHPSLEKFAKLYQDKQLAIIQGVGYPNPNLSHFRSLEIWQTAYPNSIASTGWLGRYIDETASDDNLFPGINLDLALPKSLSANKIIVPSIANFPDFKFNVDSHFQNDEQSQIQAFKSIYKNFRTKNSDLNLIKHTGIGALESTFKIPDMVANYKILTTYPNNEFANKLKYIACLIANNCESSIYNLSLSGFDTHANQAYQQANLLKNLSDSLYAFHQDLEAHKVSDNVMTLIFSEFGRRPSQNDGQGTDHGTSQPVLIIGSKIKGNLYGQYPSLSNLDSGNLKHDLDFRSIYATILDKWLNADSQAILGRNYEILPFV